MLTEEEKSRLMLYRWERIPAEGKWDKDYTLRPLYLSDIHQRFPATESTPPSADSVFLMHPHRFACLNVRGEGKLKIEVVKMMGRQTEGESQLPVSVQRLDDTGTVFRAEKHLPVISDYLVLLCHLAERSAFGADLGIYYE